MTRERAISGAQIAADEDLVNYTLRPTSLSEYIGQRDLCEKLSVPLEAAQKRGEPCEHVLLHGPPGLGKTTLAHIIAHEMGARTVSTSGPSLTRTGDLMGILTNLNEGDVLFIDEIHRLSPAIEEFIYPAIESFKVDFVVDKGAYAKVINVPLKRFTLVGATTRAGLLSAPLRDRFGLFFHLDFYPVDELAEIITRSAHLLECPIDPDSAERIARRSRGTPRIANRLLRRVRDYASVKSNGAINPEISDLALAAEGIDEAGLDDLDRRFLTVALKYYNGGPVGIEALAATLSEEVDTLVDMVEPFLLKIGFLQRTRRGREVTKIACDHLDFKLEKVGSGGNQTTLFSPKSDS